jgi:predicted transcriptional regulator
LDRSKKASEIRLGRLELQIMNAVWDHGKATVHDVKEAIGTGRTPAYTTILTMMRKLEAKGYLEHEKDERTYVYRSTITRRDVRHSLLRDLLERVFDGSPTALVNSLVEQNRVTDKELHEIQKFIGGRRRQNE